VEFSALRATFPARSAKYRDMNHEEYIGAANSRQCNYPAHGISNSLFPRSEARSFVIATFSVGLRRNGYFAVPWSRTKLCKCLTEIQIRSRYNFQRKSKLIGPRSLTKFVLRPGAAPLAFSDGDLAGRLFR
jgi:hypothetical protein